MWWYTSKKSVGRVKNTFFTRKFVMHNRTKVNEVHLAEMRSVMGKRKDVKLEDIARELGISIVSVSNVLNGRKGVSEGLRQKVLEKARELGYKMADSARFREEESWCIGIIVAERYIKEYPSFYMEVYRQIAGILTRRGNQTVLEVVDEDREKLRYSRPPFADIDLQGVIMVGEMHPEYIEKLKKATDVPVVCVDFYRTEGDVDYIATDSFHGMQLVTQKLIDYGHKKIGFVGTVHATSSIMDRYMGYCKALQINGLREHEEWVIDDREKDGYGYLLDFVLPAVLPTAFVCNCDKCAYILIDKLRRRGIRVPEDISVAGFDYFYQGTGKEPELLTYESDWKAMAQVSVNTLLKRIMGKKPPEGVRIVEGGVVIGNTARRI